MASLFAAIREAWGADTSIDPSWSAACPAQGQCAVTALVIQDYLGGQLVRGEVDGASHYWNLVGQDPIDLTRDQFSNFAPVHVATRARSYVLSFDGTAQRYQRLRDSVATILDRQNQAPSASPHRAAGST